MYGPLLFHSWILWFSRHELFKFINHSVFLILICSVSTTVFFFGNYQYLAIRYISLFFRYSIQWMNFSKIRNGFDLRAVPMWVSHDSPSTRRSITYFTTQSCVKETYVTQAARFQYVCFSHPLLTPLKRTGHANSRTMQMLSWLKYSQLFS